MCVLSHIVDMRALVQLEKNRSRNDSCRYLFNLDARLARHDTLP